MDSLSRPKRVRPYTGAFRAAVLRYRKTPRGVYATHKKNAKQRGIPFLLSFEQWWQVWQDSGRFEQRGNRRGKYCMCRTRDSGPYELGNVRIDEWRSNVIERNRTVAQKNRLQEAWQNSRGWTGDFQPDDVPF